MSKLVTAVLATAAVSLVAGGFAWVDYKMAQDVDRSTVRIRAKVIREEPVYKKLNGDYITPGSGLLAKLGTSVNDAINLGNLDVAYVVESQEVRYQTTGAIFFSSSSVVEPVKEEHEAVIIVSADIANEGQVIEFEPFYREGIVNRLLGRYPKNVFFNTGEQRAYTNPLVNPKSLSLIR